MRTIKISIFALATFLVASCEKQADNTATEVADTNTEATTQEVAALNDNTTGDATNANTVANDEVKVNAADAPVLALASSTYDFGDVQANTSTEKVIEFTNEGNTPLIIKNAKASCGCTVPEYSEEPIAPGEKGSLKVSYKAPGTNGKQTKTVTLTTNTANGTETFKIAANVVGGQEKKAPQPRPQQPSLPAPNLGQQ